jgi:alkylhydroperoxidase family enzyme
MNTGLLMRAGVTPEEIEATKADPSNAPLDEKDAAMLAFVVKVIKDSHSTNAEDLESLRKLGWTDKDILDATWHATSQVASDMLFNAFKIDAD